MSKKKAIKIMAATAMAASAFAAVAPTQADAASKVPGLVKDAKAAMKKPYTTYITGKKYVERATVQKEVKAAEKAYAAAKKAVNASKYSAATKKRLLKEMKGYEKYVSYAKRYDAAALAAHRAGVALNKEVAKLDGLVKADDLAGVQALLTKIKADAKAADAAIVKGIVGKNPEKQVKARNTVPALEAVAKFEKDNADFLAGVAKVTTVSAINATQVQFTFNKAVDAETLFVDGESGALVSGVLSFRSIDGLTDGTLTGELSQDGKVLTVTSTQLLENRYDVVLDKVKSLSGDAVEKYAQIITIAKDVTAPTLNGVERITASQVKIKFSEPMASAGSTTFRLSDGTLVANITGQGTLVDGGKAVILDLSHTDVPVNKDITATIIGAADKAGNLLTPNPATVTFQKGAKDGVAPTVSTITQTGAQTFEIQFSEVIVGKPTVAIDNVNVNPTNVVINSKDATKVTVTAPAVLNGDKIITVSGAVDGSGEVGTTTNRVVKFVKDEVAPQIVSAAVVADASDKAEYLEITFDKNVALNASTIDVTGGSYVKDYVTTSLADADISVQSLTYKSASDKKVVRVKLATLLGAKDVEGARYSVNLAFANVSSEFGVAISSGTATFTRGKDGVLANTDVQVLSTVAQGSDNNKVVVTFEKNVDPASATTVANYIVGGAVVQSATVSSTNLKQVVLTLANNSNTFTGFRNVTVQNVKAAGSTVAMTTTTKAVELNENVVPTVTAQLQSDLKTIKLTFSENVYQVANNTADFGLYVGTDKYMWNDDVDTDPNGTVTPDVAFEKDSGLGTTVAAATNTITIVLPTTVTASQLTKGLSLKALSGIDIKDTAGNSLSVSGNIAISNN